MKRRLFALVCSLMIIIPIACIANEKTPDTKEGEGEWGMNGVAMVRAFDINTHFKHRDYVIGNLRNISPDPIKNLVVTVGRHEKGDTLTTLGTDQLKLNLAPNEVWRWSVETETHKRQGYELLGVTVDGQILSKLNP